MPPYYLSQEDIERATAGWSMDETRTVDSVRSHANVQRKLESVLQNLSDFVDVEESHRNCVMRYATLMQENLREQGTHV